MNSTDMVSQFRSEMSDLATPYLWSDTEVYGYIDEAQTRFFRKTDGIADARTPEVVRLNLLPGVDWYATHPSILNVRKITRHDDGRPVGMFTAEQADSADIVFSPDRPGEVRRVVLGIEPHMARVWPMPPTHYGLTTISAGNVAVGASAIPIASGSSVRAGMGLTALGIPVGTLVTAVTSLDSSVDNVTVSFAATAAIPVGTTLSFGTVIDLSVYRLPLVPITDEGDQNFEVDPQHHAALLYWVKSRAYDKQDAETFDRRKSDDFAARFDAYCASAQRDLQRARRVQGNVVYGGL